MPDASSLDDIRQLVARGELLLAYDEATALLARDGDDAEAKYLSVLALARAGATVRALEQYDAFDLGGTTFAGSPDRLREDALALRARLDKDRALAATDDEGRRSWARRSADGYQRLFDSTGSAYPGVNAATMRLLSGAPGDSEALARRVLESATGPAGGHADDYWTAVTRAEALLLVGRHDDAHRELQNADRCNGGDLAARATTRRQLELVCGLKGIDAAVLEPLANPAVVHYCGHRAASASGGDPLGSTDEARVRAQIEQALASMGAGFGFGSLASGADILAAEALLHLGAELHVVLPFAVDEFVDVSVADGGPSWVSRFHECLDGAASVTMATEGEYLDDPILFDYCARLAMGDALVRASFLQSAAHQIAVWDGDPAEGRAGTATDVARWAATGNPATIVPVHRAIGARPSTPPAFPRQIRSLLFADMAGFSRLTDAQVLVFTREVITVLATVVDDFAAHVLSRETWGDGIYLVLDDVRAAAECALALQVALQSIDFDALGLGSIRGMRIGAHVGPVFEGWDPISNRPSFAGSHVTRAARIEPRTPEGEVYVTHAFAALAALESPEHVWCQYVGRVPAAKDYGALPMYVLKPRRQDSAGVPLQRG